MLGDYLQPKKAATCSPRPKQVDITRCIGVKQPPAQKRFGQSYATRINQPETTHPRAAVDFSGNFAFDVSFLLFRCFRYRRGCLNFHAGPTRGPRGARCSVPGYSLTLHGGRCPDATRFRFEQRLHLRPGWDLAARSPLQRSCRSCGGLDLGAKTATPRRGGSFCLCLGFIVSITWDDDKVDVADCMRGKEGIGCAATADANGLHLAIALASPPETLHY